MPSFDERIRGERKIEEMEREKRRAAIVPTDLALNFYDCVIVRSDPNAHLGATEDE